MTVALAVVIGFVGGAVHLAVTALRARAAGTGSVGSALLLAPLAIAGPLAAVAAVLAVDPAAIWAVPVGLIASRFALVPRLGRMLEDSWTQ